MDGWEIIENALGRRAENLVSGNDRWVAGGMARGNVDSHPHRPAERTRRNASPDSGQPQHPDTDHHLPQVWADGACCRTSCQRARLDLGVGPVRSRVEGSNSRAGKRMGSIPQATSTGHRRKSLVRRCGRLSALKIASRFPAHRRQFGSNPCPLEHTVSRPRDRLRRLQARLVARIRRWKSAWSSARFRMIKMPAGTSPELTRTS